MNSAALKAIFKKEIIIIILAGGVVGFFAGNQLFSEKKASLISALPEEEELPLAPPPALQRTRVAQVIDGDTIELETGERLRYIGIDAPEGAWPGKEPECYAEEAREANRILVEGQEIDMESDVSGTDKFGRLLRYVYRDDVLINKALVEKGAAFAVSYPPDVKFEAVFKAAENEAMQKGEGLWSVCGYSEEKRPNAD